MRSQTSLLVAVIAFSCQPFCQLVFAQDAGAAGGAAAPTGGAPTGGNTSGGNTRGNGRTNSCDDPSARTSNPNCGGGLGSRPIFLSGLVTLPDGTPPPSSAKIERVCDANIRVEGYTDRKGRFNFEVGRNMDLADASTAGGPDPFGGNGARGGFGGLGNTGSSLGGGRFGEQSLWGCELRASLGGFRSSSIQLTNIHYMDNPDVGTIILMPMGKVEGLTVSATTALAPKDAKKAYEKGLDLLKKNPVEALANFEKATSLYPKHAAAWYELGKLYEGRSESENARKAYDQSIAADSKYVAPYDRIAWMQLKESQWEQMAETTGQIIRLNPFEYPSAFYLHAVANFQMKKWDEAEKDARETLKLDLNKRFQRAHYILGLTLAQKQDFAAASESLKAFLAAEPKANDAQQIRSQLEQVETAFKEKQAAK